MIARPTDAVHWYDGLLLGAGHFEQLCQRQEELLVYQLRTAAPYAWGVRALAIDDALLTENVFAVTRLEAIMPDGLVVMHTGEQALKFALGKEHLEAMSTGEDLKLYLAVARRGQPGTEQRYRPCDPDDPQGETAAIARLRPALRLVADKGFNPGHDVALPLAVLGLDNQTLTLRTFMPPLLDIGVEPLYDMASLQQRAAEVRAAMASLALELGRQAANANGQDELVRRIELRDRLRSVSASLPALSGLLGMDRVPPAALYLCMCNVLGSLALLQDWTAAPRALPAYQHDQLEHCFSTLFAQALELLGSVGHSYFVHPFGRDDPMNSAAFQLRLRPAWLEGWPVEVHGGGAARSVLVIGVRGIGSIEARRWIESAAIASAGALRRAIANRSLGVARSAIENDGTLGPLTGDREHGGASRQAPDGRVDVGLLRSGDTTLFALELDAAQVHADEPLVLDWSGLPRPGQVVLFVRNTGGAASA